MRRCERTVRRESIGEHDKGVLLMDELITVIIPVYNTEKYLRKCLKSILCQTYDKLEIILVDDGSEDNSGKICDEFKDIDERIFVIHQKNCGVSDARNKGLDAAKGKYVIFVDSDDFVDCTYICELYSKMEEFDIAICGIGRYILGEKQENLLEQMVLDKAELVSQTIGNNYIGGYLVNKIFSLHIIRENNIRFNNKVHIGEDMLWILQYLEYCSKGIYISRTLYYYRLNSQSVLQYSIQRGIFDKKNLEVLWVNNLLRDAILVENDLVKRALSYRYIRSDMRLLFNMISCKYKDKAAFCEIKKQAQKNILRYQRYKGPTRLERVVAVGMCISPYSVWCAGVACNKMFNNFFKKYLN